MWFCSLIVRSIGASSCLVDVLCFHALHAPFSCLSRQRPYKIHCKFNTPRKSISIENFKQNLKIFRRYLVDTFFSKADLADNGSVGHRSWVICKMGQHDVIGGTHHVVLTHFTLGGSHGSWVNNRLPVTHLLRRCTQSIRLIETFIFLCCLLLKMQSSLKSIRHQTYFAGLFKT